MVRQVIHTKRILYSLIIAAIASITVVSSACMAVESSGNVDFQVDVTEVLSVSLTAPAQSSGLTGDLVRNKVNLSVTSNNAIGFVAYMHADNTQNSTGCKNVSSTDTSLVNCDQNMSTIATLASAANRSSFPANNWGYSVNDDSSTTDSTSTATYGALVGASATPTTVLANSMTASDSNVTVNGATRSRDIWFGAKIDSSTAAGTYAGTVVFTVVSGVTTSDPYVEPVNPATPTGPTGDTTVNDNIATYNSTYNRTVYTTTTTTGTGDSTTTKTTSDVSTGDNRSSYATAQGVTTTSVGEGTPLATGLAVTAAIAATSGFIFFIIAKRKKDDDEEEEDQQMMQ